MPLRQAMDRGHSIKIDTQHPQYPQITGWNIPLMEEQDA